MSNSTMCAIVVTYNRLTLLKECLEAISDNPEVAHVVVINNNSSDGTTEFLGTLDPQHYIVHNSADNLGGAGGFALGMELAFQQTEDKYFWIMDDDTIPQSGSAQALVAKASLLKDEFGFLCSDVRWIDGTSCNMPGPAEDWPELIQKGLVRVVKGTFVSIMVSRQTVMQLGIPTKELFIWGDDTEYTTRVSQNMSSYFVIESHVVHKTPNNLTGISIFNDSPDRIGRYYYLYRNLMYISRLYQGKKPSFKLFLSQVLTGFKALVGAKDHRWVRCSTVVRGTFAGVRFNPPIKMVNKQKVN